MIHKLFFFLFVFLVETLKLDFAHNLKKFDAKIRKNICCQLLHNISSVNAGHNYFLIFSDILGNSNQLEVPSQQIKTQHLLVIHSILENTVKNSPSFRNSSLWKLKAASMSFSFITENLKLWTNLGSENSTTTFHKDQKCCRTVHRVIRTWFWKFHHHDCTFKCFLEEKLPIPGELKQLLRVTAVEIWILPQILNVCIMFLVLGIIAETITFCSSSFFL